MKTTADLIHKACTDIAEILFYKNIYKFHNPTGDSLKAAFNTIIDSKNIKSVFLMTLDELTAIEDADDTFLEYIKPSALFSSADCFGLEDIDVGKIIENNCNLYGLNSEERIVNEIVSQISENVAQKTVELYYYWMFHKEYDKELEEAYREVVDRAARRFKPHTRFSDRTDLLFVKNAEILSDGKVIDYLKNVRDNICSDVYDDVYGHEDLDMKYIMPREEYYTLIKNDVDNILRCENVISTKTENKLIIPKRYKMKAYNIIRRLQYFSLDMCWEKDNIEMPLSSYRSYFCKDFFFLAGFNYEKVKELYMLTNRFILRTMVDDLNVTMRKSKNEISVEYIGNDPQIVLRKMDSMKTLSDISEFVIQIMIGKFGNYAEGAYIEDFKQARHYEYSKIVRKN